VELPRAWGWWVSAACVAESKWLALNCRAGGQLGGISTVPAKDGAAFVASPVDGTAGGACGLSDGCSPTAA
jgi:hypothetical protein